jgi:hypothetical protein
VTGGRLREIRDFTADPDLAHFLLKQQTNRLIQAADGKIEVERITCERDQILNQQVIQSIVTC